MRTFDQLPPPPAGKSGWPWTADSVPVQAEAGLPRISVVTPSFNQGRFLEEAIRSVLFQGYPDVEYFIMDGGSTDNSVEVIRKYEPWLAGWESVPDRGQSHAINKGWRRAAGDIIAWINGDDAYLPGAFEAAARIFAAQKDAVVLSGAGQTRTADLSAVLSTKPPSRMDPYAMIRACGHVPLQPSVFLRRRVLDEAGYLDENLHYVMDWEYWIRLGLRYPESAFAVTEKALSMNREWPGTKTNLGFEDICAESRRVFASLEASRPGDAMLHEAKGMGRRASFRKQAELALKLGLRGSAAAAAARALAIEPLAHSPRHELILLVKALTGRGSPKC